jgi:hypothetical protein
VFNSGAGTTAAISATFLTTGTHGVDGIISIDSMYGFAFDHMSCEHAWPRRHNEHFATHTKDEVPKKSAVCLADNTMIVFDFPPNYKTLNNK